MNNLEIARICHQANKAYCESLGDRSQLDWEAAPEWQRQSALNGVLFRTECPNTGGYAGSHENWLKEKVADGWIYGEVKDVEAKKHPCMVEWSELPKAQQFKDRLFCAIVDALVDRDLDADCPLVG
jgi:RyR domain